MALTAAARHLGPQLSPLVSRTLPGVAPPTTWVARMSFYPPKQRMRCVSGFAFSQSARRHTLPNRVRFTAHRQFASGCSPPRFAATQLPSTTGSWLTPTWTLTMLCTRLHGRTRSPPRGRWAWNTASRTSPTTASPCKPSPTGWAPTTKKWLTCSRREAKAAKAFWSPFNQMR
jgi:hypothetical protein